MLHSVLLFKDQTITQIHGLPTGPSSSPLPRDVAAPQFSKTKKVLSCPEQQINLLLQLESSVREIQGVKD